MVDGGARNQSGGDGGKGTIIIEKKNQGRKEEEGEGG